MFNHEKNIKTIVLSELPKNEKVKYFQFLIENDINFTKDERGNYIALIKVLNPQFYGDVEVQQEKMKAEGKNAMNFAKTQQINNQVNNININRVQEQPKSQVPQMGGNVKKVTSSISTNRNEAYDNDKIRVKSSSMPKNLPSQNPTVKPIKKEVSINY